MSDTKQHPLDAAIDLLRLANVNDDNPDLFGPAILVLELVRDGRVELSPDIEKWRAYYGTPEVEE